MNENETKKERSRVRQFGIEWDRFIVILTYPEYLNFP